MKRLNWAVRFKNPLFLAQIFLSIGTPILAYLGLNWSDITTWAMLGNVLKSAILNPYILGLVVVSVFNAVTDPTTVGISDSKLALTYDVPKSIEKE